MARGHAPERLRPGRYGEQVLPPHILINPRHPDALRIAQSETFPYPLDKRLNERR